ncbi:MAG: hypothetical protein IPO32_10705 [Crocinitomicaceae bacterium]|nr:hypothetical protein [Crocinitomicaceae bacterium]
MKFGLHTIVFSLILFGSQALAQPGPGERPKIGILTGQVVEPEFKKAIPYAKIFLLNVRDSSVATGGLADSLGNLTSQKFRLGLILLKSHRLVLLHLYIDSLFFHRKRRK